MSGISGYFQTEFDVERNHTLFAIYENKLAHMMNSLKDELSEKTSMFLRQFVGLAACTNEHEPFSNSLCTVYYKNREASIAFSGKIHNFDELYQTLPLHEISLSEITTEKLILYLYFIQGTSFFSSLRGNFMFAIYENDSILLVQDSIGTKPLFYYSTNNHFIFASNQESIAAYSNKPDFTIDSNHSAPKDSSPTDAISNVACHIHQVPTGNYVLAFSDNYGHISLSSYQYTSHTI